MWKVEKKEGEGSDENGGKEGGKEGVKLEDKEEESVLFTPQEYEINKKNKHKRGERGKNEPKKWKRKDQK